MFNLKFFLITSLAVIATHNRVPCTCQVNSSDAAKPEMKDSENGVEKCNKFVFGNSSAELLLACKCDHQYCDSEYDIRWPIDDSYVVQFESNANGARFRRKVIRANVNTPSEAPNNEGKKAQGNSDKPKNVKIETNFVDIFIRSNIRKQQVLGYGAAITDSAALQVNSLPRDLRDQLIDSCFSASGSAYNLARVPIGGTDFSEFGYSLDDTPKDEPDFELAHFRLSPFDLQQRVPLLKDAQKRLDAREHSPRLLLFAASWSAPVWMKSGGDSFVKGSLKDGKVYSDAYASYLVKFLASYAAQNVSVFALSPQNEPRAPSLIANYKGNSVEFSPNRMREFVASSLVPKLAEFNANKTDQTRARLVLWDDDLVGANSYAQTMLDSRDTAQATSGLAWHWYSQVYNASVRYSAMSELRGRLPSQYWTVSSEASFLHGPSAGNWTRAEMYARDIIENLNLGSSVGWIDWNLALNMSGGFTWTGNILDSAILVDSGAKVFYKNPIFYSLMHFSRFVKSNSSILPVDISTSRLVEKISARQVGANSTVEEVQVSYQSSFDSSQQDRGPVFAVAAELESDEERQRRKLALVVLNEEAAPKTPRDANVTTRNVARVFDSETGLKLFDFELNPSSISSFAFVI